MTSHNYKRLDGRKCDYCGKKILIKCKKGKIIRNNRIDCTSDDDRDITFHKECWLKKVLE